jgi:hypothetical protein
MDKDLEPMDNLDFNRKPRSLRTKNMDVSRQNGDQKARRLQIVSFNHLIPTVSMATDGTRDNRYDWDIAEIYNRSMVSNLGPCLESCWAGVNTDA